MASNCRFGAKKGSRSIDDIHHRHRDGFDITIVNVEDRVSFGAGKDQVNRKMTFPVVADGREVTSRWFSNLAIDRSSNPASADAVRLERDTDWLAIPRPERFPNSRCGRQP